MKRWLVRICLFLILGAIVNVAVAWTIVLRRAPATFVSANFYQSHPDRPTWYYNLSRHSNHQWLVACAVPFADVGWAYVPSQTLSWSIVDKRPPPNTSEYIPARDVGLWLEEGSGWPEFSVMGRVHVSGNMDTINHSYYGIAVRRTGPMIADGSVLPLRPIRPGFAINTVFYAVVLWLLFAGPFVVRRWRRIRRGLCPKCA